MLERLDELAAERADFAFETTLASRTFAPFIRRLIGEGYRFRLVYVWLNSADLCVSRVASRFRSGGHHVDEAIVRRRYERSLRNFFSLYRPLADDWRAYDNSSRIEPRLVAQGQHDDVVALYDEAVWDEMVRRAGRERER
jgi:predicted ABC-type ATPase